MEVADYIKVGHRNAVSRKDLRLLTGFGDRKVRSEIQHLRATLPIIIQEPGIIFRTPRILSTRRKRDGIF